LIKQGLIMRVLTAIPVYNEQRHLRDVLREVRRYANDILIIDDGSTDATPRLLAAERDLHVVTHAKNSGYGAALISAFNYAIDQGFDVLVTTDCDGQHEPSRIPVLVEAIHDSDIVSGSRYLRSFRENSTAPPDRMEINLIITAEINQRFGMCLTDTFCGFKAYRVEALKKLRITEKGWGMPLQLWVQASRLKLRIKEVGVPRIYLDPKRAFGGVLNDKNERLAYYRRVIDDATKDYLPDEPKHQDADYRGWFHLCGCEEMCG
jgi:glycosyltransferase involved in cell wall biosynthesis